MQHTPDPALRCFQLALMLLVMCGLGTAAAQRMSSWQQAESVSTLAYEPGQRVRFHFGLAADWDAGDGRRGFAGVLTIRSEERGTVSIDGIRFRMDAEIADSWNGDVSTYEDGFSLRPDPWNVTLEYGQARSFGLTGTYAGAFGPPHDFRMAGRVTVPSPEPAAIAEHCPFDAEITHVSPAGSEGSRFLAEVLVDEHRSGGIVLGCPGRRFSRIRAECSSHRHGRRPPGRAGGMELRHPARRHGQLHAGQR